MNTITRLQLSQNLSNKLGMHPLLAHDILNSVISTIQESLAAGDRIELRGFGHFEPLMSKPCIGRNPKKPDKGIVIPARKTVRFYPSKKFLRDIRSAA